MAEWLKRGRTAEIRKEGDRKVREIVETALAEIEAGGDAAVRAMSVRFDGWDRESYALTEAEKQACLDQLSDRDLLDIEVAQEQVRNFAKIQRESIRDAEVETPPGVVSATATSR